nr:hypothetical protein [Tanacetum cinerariifolium]GFA77022.1 hypothetical protein [Tanacetum cinerariifolium]
MLHVLRVAMVLNSPWILSKNWLVQKQMAFGKDTSNPFMANNLPKIVWFSTHHITFMKSWLVQKQTALGQTVTGKESSNPFLAGVNTCRSDEDKLKLMELMVFLLQKDVTADKQAKIYNIDLDHSSKVLSMPEDDLEVQDVVEVVTTAKLITEVDTTAASQGSAASATIPAVSATILAAAPTIVDAYTRRRKGVIIRDLEEELPLKTPAETPKVKDKGKGILVEAPKPMKKKDQIEMDVEYARKLQEEIDRDHDGFNKDIY